jgi:hypothetical protein
MIRANVPKYKVKGLRVLSLRLEIECFCLHCLKYFHFRLLVYIPQIALLVAEIRLEFVCEYFMTTLGARGPRGKGIMKRELSPALVLPRTFVRAVVQPGGLDHLRISTNRVGRAYLS